MILFQKRNTYFFVFCEKRLMFEEVMGLEKEVETEEDRERSQGVVRYAPKVSSTDRKLRSLIRGHDLSLCAYFKSLAKRRRRGEP